MLLLQSKTPACYTGLGVGFVVLQLAAFLWGTAPFRMGMWLQTEPMECGLLLVAALQAAWCFYGLQKRWLQAVYFRHWLWWTMLLWVGWQIVTWPFAESAWRAWFGHPAHGIGISWHLSLWLCTVAVFALWRNLHARNWMLYGCLGLLLAQVALYAFLNPLSSGEGWFPATFGGYLAHMAAWLWVAWVISRRRLSYVRLFGMAVVVAWAVHVSESRAAIALFLPAMLVTYLAMECRHVSFVKQVPPWLRVLAMLGVLVPAMLWNVAWTESSWFPDKRGSMAIRAAMHEVGFHALRDEPSRLLAGKGWGAFFSDSFRYALTEGTYLYKDGKYTSYAPLHESLAFHSHDQGLEALLQLGVTGWFLWVLFPLAVLAALPAQYFWRVAPMFMAIMVMNCLWFYFPMQLAYIAMGYAALACICLPKRQGIPLSLPLSRTVVAAVCMVLILSGGWYGHAVAQGASLLAIARAGGSYSPDMVEDDLARGGDRLAFAVQQQIMARNSAQGQGSQSLPVNSLASAARKLAEHPASSLSYVTLEPALHETHAAYLHADAPLQVGMEAWKLSVMRMVQRVPERDDLVAGFLQAVDASPRSLENKILIYKNILRLSPACRPAQWLIVKTRIENQQPLSAEERTMLFRMLNNGLTHVYPVKTTEIQDKARLSNVHFRE